mmetsp:Transcript_16735/g.36937  ORF Transcript_16735/g.36937 Transcript_16735/m.36937 type:complete len:203 (+) Transcript_16735:1317-1925(+)
MDKKSEVIETAATSPMTQGFKISSQSQRRLIQKGSMKWRKSRIRANAMRTKSKGVISSTTTMSPLKSLLCTQRAWKSWDKVGSCRYTMTPPERACSDIGGAGRTNSVKVHSNHIAKKNTSLTKFASTSGRPSCRSAQRCPSSKSNSEIHPGGLAMRPRILASPGFRTTSTTSTKSPAFNSTLISFVPNMCTVGTTAARRSTA